MRFATGTDVLPFGANEVDAAVRPAIPYDRISTTS